MASAMYEVGQKVRVTVGPGRTCRGLVLCAGSSEQGDPTYDVLLQSPETAKNTTAPAAEDVHPDADRSCTSGAGGDRELTGLPPTALSLTQPFEVDGSVDRPVPRGLSADEVSALADALKAMGNTLFKLGDTDAAAEVFGKVLRILEPPPETGSTVLVRVLTGDAAATVSRYRSGMVSDAEDDSRSYDVIYDETDLNGNGDGVGADEEEDEEDGVAAERVVAVSLSPCVSCAARLNLARCSFRKGEHAKVVEACTLVMSLAKLTMADKQRPREERATLRAHCLTALRMRGGSHLAQNHVGQARKDARSMARSAGDAESRAQAARFEGEVERKAKALLKANRKLAKDVTRWVDASMAKHEGASTKGGDGGDPPPISPPPGSGRQLEGRSEGLRVGEGGVEECKGSEQPDVASGRARSWLGSLLR